MHHNFVQNLVVEHWLGMIKRLGLVGRTRERVGVRVSVGVRHLRCACTCALEVYATLEALKVCLDLCALEVYATFEALRVYLLPLALS